MQEPVFVICVLLLMVLIIYSFLNKPTKLQVYLRIVTSVVILGVIWIMRSAAMPTIITLSLVLLSTIIKAVSDLRKINSQMPVRHQ
jgi:hypothetical protein